MVSVVVDSGIDLPEEQLQEVTVVPLKIIIGNKEYKDTEIPLKEIIDLNRKGKGLKTSQPSIKDFKYVFEELKEPIFYLGLSNKLSGTFETAKIAARMVDKQIETFNTLSAGVGGGLLVKYVLENKKKSIKELIQNLKEKRTHLRVFFTVKDLEQLVRSGRLNSITGRIGDLLNLKPVFHPQNGGIKVLKKVRGYDEAVEFISNRIQNEEAWITQFNSLEEAERMSSVTKSSQILDLCPTLAVHLGFGVGAAWFSNSA